MYTISKQFSFSAAHHLPMLPDGHRCKNPHGHNWIVEVILASSELNEFGFVVDYGDLKPLKEYIDAMFDHRDLNAWYAENVLGDVMPTAECLAQHFFIWCKQRWAETVKVKVSETPGTWAAYSGR